MSEVQKVRLRKVRYWRIAVGHDPAQWAAWQMGNFVALEWDELGDLTQLTRREFVQRRDAILARFPERTKASADQVWTFARRIHEGDRIIAARSSQAILGVATVVGPYFFVPDVYRGHCLPVEWNDLTPRQASLPNWRRTVVELNFAQFDALLHGEPLAESPPTDRQLREPPVEYETKPVEKRASAAPAPVVVGPQPPTTDAGSQPLYDLPQLAATLALPEAKVALWVRAVERKGQLIFTGPPGVGKTFAARELARHLVSGGDGFWEVVQFHAAYSYEDFVQGLRPRATATGGLAYHLEPGRLLDFCRRASTRRGRCVLVIDEINRANLANVFGELLYLLEYRDQAIWLAGGNQPFALPANMRLLGSMNSADRSIALVDHALRRRFALVELGPNYELLTRFHSDRQTNFPTKALIKLLKSINNTIGDHAYALGVSYFLRPDLAETLADIWQMEIEPYLNEYFFDQPEQSRRFRWSQVRAELALPNHHDAADA